MPVDASLLYKRSLQSEHRVRERTTEGRTKYFWRLKAGKAQNHLWDCEVYCAASAWHQLFHRLVDPSELVDNAPMPDDPDDDWLRGRGGDDFLGGRGDNWLRRRRWSRDWLERARNFRVPARLVGGTSRCRGPEEEEISCVEWRPVRCCYCGSKRVELRRPRSRAVASLP